MNRKTIILVQLLLSIFVFSVSCSDSKQRKPSEKQFKCSLSSGQIFSGEDLKISVSSLNNNSVDSLRISILHAVDTVVVSSSITLKTKHFPLGKQKINISVISAGKEEKHNSSVLILTKQKPNKKTFSIKNSFPHDDAAYTQGLFYADSIMYESTGMKGRSSLRKVEIETGKAITFEQIEDYYFGEGSCLLNDKIYMLTWQSRKGFVYNKDSFERISEFTYPTEGWGITTDGEKLLMSDGSNNIYFMDPDSFSEIGRIQVYNSQGPVYALNELEYIDGYIYANVYQTDLIVKIQSQTGLVVDEINLEGILDGYQTPNANVLNGIAYDAESDKIYVTGKNWARLFEVEFKDYDNSSSHVAETVGTAVTPL